MFNHNWLIWSTALLAWLLICEHNLGINGQSENAIGAHREYQKTSFSCTGRPAGYYADIETGCQVYHMCDGLGRQFSYSCPNTTLFQQRMLICDHWYMVNCSKAESDYAANLLIGQRDKPFVNDEENSLRTPRPDLLDRPYAPDYSGESFRNQYKNFPALQNRILDTDAQKNQEKPKTQTSNPQQIPPGQQRWEIPPPSRLILPPAYEPTIELDTRTNTAKTTATATPSTAVTASSRYRTTSSSAATRTYSSTTTRRPYTAPASPPSTAALHQRQDEHEDLGTSHSTRYNTSADFNSAEAPIVNKPAFKVSFSSGTLNTKATSKPLQQKLAIKVPSKFYEPPVLYPIYNENETLSTTQKPLIISTAAPFTSPSTKRPTTTTTTLSTTIRPFTRPTTMAGKPFSVSLLSQPNILTPSTASSKQQNSDRFDIQKINRQDARTPTPAQGFKPPTPRPSIDATATKPPTTNRRNLPTPFISSLQSNQQSIPADLPFNDLLPPYQEFPQHDTATTQGPPIYYEWKIPTDGLEPPKLDPPYGVDGREYPETIIDYNTINNADGFVPSQSFGIDQQSSSGFRPSLQPSSTTRTPTIRSIKQESTQLNQNGLRQSTANKQNSVPSPDIFQIRKDLSVPEYSFPLETIGRTGYLATDTYNSFQLKIPERRSDEKVEHLHWFGENPKCPECHPSYVVPGTCQPCLRR